MKTSSLKSVFACALGAVIALMIVSSAVDAQPGRMSPQGGTITSVTAGSGATGGGTSGPVTINVGAGSGIAVETDSVTIDPTYTQRRVSGTCAAGNAIRVVNEDGTVTCEPAGAGVDGGGTANTIPKWSDPDTLADSSITDSGTLVSVAAPLQVQALRETIVSASALTGTINDWAPAGIATATVIRAEASAGGATITGITGGVDGRLLTIYNASGESLSFLHDSASSAAANRIYTCAAFNATDHGGELTSTTFLYSSAEGSGTGRWVQQCRTTLPHLHIENDLEVHGATVVEELRGTVQTSALTGTQNDFALSADATIVYFTNAGALTLTGMVGGTEGRCVWLVAAGGSVVDIPHENTGSVATSRFTNSGNATWRSNINEIVNACYLSSRWRFDARRQLATLTVSSAATIGTNIDVGGQTGTSSLAVTGTATLYGASTTLGNASTDALTVNSTSAFTADVALQNEVDLNDDEGDTTDLYGKLYTRGTAPTLSTCGTSPSIVGNDKVGQFTTGTGTATSCTITFDGTWSTNAPVCVLTPVGENAMAVTMNISAESTSAITVDFSVSCTGCTFNYHCIGWL